MVVIGNAIKSLRFITTQDKSNTENTRDCYYKYTIAQLVATSFSTCCKAPCKPVIMAIIQYWNNLILDYRFGFWMKKRFSICSFKFFKFATTSSFKEQVFLYAEFISLKFSNKCFWLLQINKLKDPLIKSKQFSFLRVWRDFFKKGYLVECTG